MEVYHGTWGKRVVTRKDNYTLTTILYLDPKQRCSWHTHKTAYNQFFVISGELGVKTNCGPKETCRVTHVFPGQIFTVPPGVTHEFKTYKYPTIVEEIAYVQYDQSDIDRIKLGGAREYAHETEGSGSV